MAVLGDKNTFAVGFFFYGILKKWLAYSVRNVGKGNVDVLILLCMAIYNSTNGGKECFVILARKVHPPP